MGPPSKYHPPHKRRNVDRHGNNIEGGGAAPGTANGSEITYVDLGAHDVFISREGGRFVNSVLIYPHFQVRSL